MTSEKLNLRRCELLQVKVSRSGPHHVLHREDFTRAGLAVHKKSGVRILQTGRRMENSELFYGGSVRLKAAVSRRGPHNVVHRGVIHPHRSGRTRIGWRSDPADMRFTEFLKRSVQLVDGMSPAADHTMRDSFCVCYRSQPSRA
jgi:hypothetical protein